MKKKILSVVLASAMVIAMLAGCSSDAQVEEEEVAEVVETIEADAEQAEADIDEVIEAGETNWVSSDLMGADPAAGTDFSNIKIGEIESYIINDGGWCQANHEGLVAAMDELGIPAENLITLESIDDFDQAATVAAAEQLIKEGCNVIIGCSTGYGSYLPDVAAENPDVLFAQWGAKVDNIVGYMIRSYEGMFLSGYACGLMSDTNQFGFSASCDEFSVRTAINAYELGCKYAQEDAQLKVACADSWYDIDKETQCCQSLCDAGCKYLAGEYSSPAIPETAQKNGAFVVGYHMDRSAEAPDAVLVSFCWNFEPIFKHILIGAAEGTISTNDMIYWGGECSALTDFASFVPADVVEKVEAAKADIASGKLQVYGGELKDRDGNILVAAGENMPDDMIQLQDFYVENVDCSW